MRRRIAIQAWLPGGPQSAHGYSGARNRLLGLLDGLARIGRDSELDAWDITLLGSTEARADTSLRSLIDVVPQAHFESVAIPSLPTIKRVRAEQRLLPELAQHFDLLEMASLPLAKLSIPCNLLIHDLRDLGPYARGLIAGTRLRGIRRAVAKSSLRAAVQRAAVLCVPSPAVRQDLLARYPTREQTIVVVPAGLTAPARSTWPKLPALPKDPFVSLARPEARKDLPFALQAYATARNDTALPDFLLAGPAERAWQGLKKLARQLGVADHVHFRHDLRDDERWPLLANATALVFPSRLEGFGLPALEAALVACPVLVRRDGVPASLLGSGAIALPDSLEAWASALRRVATDSDWAQQAADRAKQQSQRFSPEAAARAWIASWELALGGRTKIANPAPRFPVT